MIVRHYNILIHHIEPFPSLKEVVALGILLHLNQIDAPRATHEQGHHILRGLVDSDVDCAVLLRFHGEVLCQFQVVTVQVNAR